MRSPDAPVVEYPSLRANLERRDSGSFTILSLEGRIHLVLSADEADLAAKLDGQTSRAELARSYEGDLDDLLSELAMAGFLEGSQPESEPRLALSSAGLEFDGFDRVVGYSRATERALDGSDRLLCWNADSHLTPFSRSHRALEECRDFKDLLRKVDRQVAWRGHPELDRRVRLDCVQGTHNAAIAPSDRRISALTPKQRDLRWPVLEQDFKPIGSV